jgi:hypothetical protein
VSQSDRFLAWFAFVIISLLMFSLAYGLWNGYGR